MCEAGEDEGDGTGGGWSHRLWTVWVGWGVRRSRRGRRTENVDVLFGPGEPYERGDVDVFKEKGSDGAREVPPENLEWEVGEAVAGRVGMDKREAVFEEGDEGFLPAVGCVVRCRGWRGGGQRDGERDAKPVVLHSTVQLAEKLA